VEPSLEIGVAVVLVSSSELYKPEEDFAIEATRAEFKATGLKRTSYAVGRAFVAVPLSALGKRLGRLEGKLASEFEIWYTRHKA
jgi:mRNA-degrading endonuclease toxin of MazEF toxin-antitoxin module